MEFRSRFRSISYSAPLLIAWLLLCMFGLHMMIGAEIKKTEQQFAQETEEISTEIRQKLLANDAVLSGFSAFLQAVEEDDQQATTRYANAAMAPYPHIYMLEVARQVLPTEQANFEESIRKNGQPYFSIHDFSAPRDEPKGAKLPSTTSWPIIFMFPAHPAAREIYGVRLETVPYLNETLRLAAQSNRAVASPVFELKESGSAYILLRSVQRTASSHSLSSPNFFGGSMVVLLLNKTSSLLPASLESHHVELDAELISEASRDSSHLFEHHLPPAHWLASKTLPLLTRVIDSGTPSQPVRLSFQRQVSWSNIFNPNFFTLVGLLLINLLLVGFGVRRHHLSISTAALEHERAQYLATHDTLTRLPNRHLLTDRFEQALHRWQRHGTKFALFIIDLDHFKSINDCHGHEAGDAVLVATAERLTHAVRASDTVARYGGDEFVALIADVLNEDDALALGEKLCQQLGQPVVWGKTSLPLTCSLGIAVCPKDGENFNTLFQKADQAMYQVKQCGRNGARLATSDT